MVRLVRRLVISSFSGNLSGAVLSYHTLIFWFGRQGPNAADALFGLFEGGLFTNCMVSFLHQRELQTANKEKRIWATNQPTNHPPLFSSLKNLLGGFTDSDESDSYAGDLVGDSGDLFTRVRRFQGSSGPPGGPGFPAGAPPRRPGFMFPPPPAGPPPEPRGLYSVLPCKEMEPKPKKTPPKNTNLDPYKICAKFG